ncbi:MAG: hypothetical protein ACUVR8_13810 [Acidobacteriota bacterium]
MKLPLYITSAFRTAHHRSVDGDEAARIGDVLGRACEYFLS